MQMAPGRALHDNLLLHQLVAHRPALRAFDDVEVRPSAVARRISIDALDVVSQDLLTSAQLAPVEPGLNAGRAERLEILRPASAGDPDAAAACIAELLALGRIDSYGRL
jgi:hypothetical protein